MLLCSNGKSECNYITRQQHHHNSPIYVVRGHSHSSGSGFDTGISLAVRRNKLHLTSQPIEHELCNFQFPTHQQQYSTLPRCPHLQHHRNELYVARCVCL